VSSDRPVIGSAHGSDFSNLHMERLVVLIYLIFR
jgi:hypothetical protein